MTKDEQEALSRACSNDVILLLQLRDGMWACFNNARELCGIRQTVILAIETFRPPAAAPMRAKASLEELGLL